MSPLKCLKMNKKVEYKKKVHLKQKNILFLS